jgi:hypothetical protein
VDLLLGGYGTNGAPLVSGSVADVYSIGEPDRTNILAWNDGAQCFESQFNHTFSTSGIRYIHPLSNEIVDPAGVPAGVKRKNGGRVAGISPGSIEFPNGFWVGDGASARQYLGPLSDAQADPLLNPVAGAAGEHARGDWFTFLDPVAGGWMGAICVTSGTPGIWKRFGPIE